MHCYVCMARACMHTVLRRLADACLLLPILADRPGGAARCHAVRVVRAGLALRPCWPSGHSREQEEVRAGTAQEEAVAWADQFPRGGGQSGWRVGILFTCPIPIRGYGRYTRPSGFGADILPRTLIHIRPWTSRHVSRPHTHSDLRHQRCSWRTF